MGPAASPSAAGKRGLPPINALGAVIWLSSHQLLVVGGDLRTSLRASWPGQAHGCPVGFLWTGCMALILLISRRHHTFLDTR
jgi:hypothetical protein